MLGLPTDIQNGVLDYVTATGDLRALCLTSKGCHKCSIPRLYRHVIISLWHRSTWLFYQQFHLRRRDYLRHTRTLVIEHQEIANPIDGAATECLERPDEAVVKLNEDLRMVTLMAVLQLFPPDVLQDFRFVSSCSIPLVALRYLCFRQRSITTMYSTYVDEAVPQHSLWSLDLFHNVRNLDLQVYRQPSIFDNFFRRLVSTPNTIENLSLTVDMQRPGCNNIYHQLSTAPTAFDLATPTRVMPRLKKLSLCGFDMRLSWLPALRSVVDFGRLTSLSITKCEFVSQFFADLGMDTTLKKFSFKHLAVDCLTENADYQRLGDADTVPLDRCLENVFQKCGELESLHVGWHETCEERGARKPIQTTVDKICRDGKSLRILAIHPHNIPKNLGEGDSLGEDLDRVCRACPNLQQLGYQLGYGVLDDCLNTEEADKALDDFVHHLMQLRNLRALHLRCPRELKVSRFSPDSFDKRDIECYLRDLATTMRYIASEIFLKLEKFQTETGLCHSLDTIVIGHLTPLRQFHGNSLPQHCFVRRQKSGIGDELSSGYVSHTDPRETQYRAVRVERTNLRQLRAQTEILDLDVGVGPFKQWAGRAL